MQDSSKSFGEVYFALCKTVDTARSLGMWLRYKHAQSELVTAQFHPYDYASAEQLEKDLLIHSFVKKFTGLNTGIDTKAAALQSFKTSEDVCKQTNIRIRERNAMGFDPDVEALIFSARRHIASVLGGYPHASMRLCSWTTGATYDLKKSMALPDQRICQLPITVTQRSVPLLRLQIETDPNWFEALTGIYPDGPFSLLKSCFEVIRGGRLTTVPKTSKTDRTIMIEPRGNMFLQKGVGNYIRKRLRSVGIDLNDQSFNQVAAAHAAESGLSTIDLEAASDTVALELVYLLLPVDWALLLDDLRSHYCELDKSWIKLEKFSSMGNGFTFELESLIFWGLSQACEDLLPFPGKSLVYGDDIIVQQQCTPWLLKLFSEMGFTVNSAKTFLSGNYFESCGKHYYGKREITPIFQKELINSASSVIRTGNRLKRASERTKSISLRHSLLTAWNCLRRSNPATLKYAIPDGTEGDDGWLVPHADLVDVRPFDPWLGFKCQVLKAVSSKTYPGHSPALLALHLRKTRKSKYLNGSPWRPKYALDILQSEPLYDNIVVMGEGPEKSGWRWVTPVVSTEAAQD